MIGCRAAVGMLVIAAVAGCSGSGPSTTAPAPAPAPQAFHLSPGLHPALLVSQAWFKDKDGHPVPQPAKLTI